MARVRIFGQISGARKKKKILKLLQKKNMNYIISVLGTNGNETYLTLYSKRPIFCHINL